MKYALTMTSGYSKWFETLSIKTQAQIEKRLTNVVDFGHFGDAKNLGDGVSELRWKSELRIYFTMIKRDPPPHEVLLLLGGNKNGQDKDIKKAKSLLR